MSAVRATGLAGALMAAAVVYQFALMPILWNESRGIPPIVWTTLSAGLMGATVLALGGHREPSAGITPWVLAFVVAYPVACALSYLLTEDGHPLRPAGLAHNVVLMALAGTFHYFGIAVGRHAPVRSIAVAAVATAAYVVASRDALTLDALYLRFEEEGRSFPYQYIGDAFAIGALLLVARRRFDAVSVLLAAAAVSVMFEIPSRSSALFGSAALLLWILAAAPPRWRAALGALALVAAASTHGGDLQPLFEGTRFEPIFTDRDTSAEARHEFLLHGLATIARYPFTGRWASEIDRFGMPGTYVHNALDVWAQGGIVPMLLLAALWLRALALWVGLLRHDRDAALRSLPLLVFPLLSWIFARNVGNAILFFGLGYFEALRSQALASVADAARSGSARAKSTQALRMIR